MRIGVPLVEPLPPPEGSAAARFLVWLEERRDFVRHLERRLLDTFDLDVAYCSVNFTHPEYGPSGRVADLAVSAEMNRRFPSEERHRRRAQMLTVPQSGMGDFPRRWEAGETVLLVMGEMGEELGRRFETTPVKWSLSAPLRYADEWFGLFGVASLEETPPSDMVISATEAGAVAIRSSFAADANEPHRRA